MDIEPDRDKNYNSEDIQVLTSLLTEYSAKLFKICDEIDRDTKTNSLIVGFLLLTLCIIGIIGFVGSIRDFLTNFVEYLMIIVLICFFYMDFIMSFTVRQN